MSACADIRPAASPSWASCQPQFGAQHELQSHVRLCVLLQLRTTDRRKTCMSCNHASACVVAAPRDNLGHSRPAASLSGASCQSQQGAQRETQSHPRRRCCSCFLQVMSAAGHAWAGCQPQLRKQRGLQQPAHPCQRSRAPREAHSFSPAECNPLRRPSTHPALQLATFANSASPLAEGALYCRVCTCGLPSPRPPSKNCAAN